MFSPWSPVLGLNLWPLADAGRGILVGLSDCHRKKHNEVKRVSDSWKCCWKPQKKNHKKQQKTELNRKHRSKLHCTKHKAKKSKQQSITDYKITFHRWFLAQLRQNSVWMSQNEQMAGGWSSYLVVHRLCRLHRKNTAVVTYHKYDPMRGSEDNSLNQLSTTKPPKITLHYEPLNLYGLINVRYLVSWTGILAQCEIKL